jgi:hypothetical protein
MAKPTISGASGKCAELPGRGAETVRSPARPQRRSVPEITDPGGNRRGSGRAGHLEYSSHLVEKLKPIPLLMLFFRSAGLEALIAGEGKGNDQATFSVVSP